MKKICIDARMINCSGIGTYLKSLISNLKDKFLEEKTLDKKKDIFDGIKFYFIINSKEKNLKIFKNFSKSKNFELIFLDASIYSVKEQILFPFKVPKCDLFFSPHFNIPLLPIRAKKRIVTIHDVYHLAYFKKLKFLEKIYAKFFISKAVLQSDKVITVSNFSKEEILKYTKVNSNKIEVIYNELNPIFSKKNEKKSNAKKLKSIFKKYFLFVGNLKEHKNLLNLLKAFKDLSKEYNDVGLVIIGRNKNLKNSIDIQKIMDINKNLKKKIKLISNLTDLDLPNIYKKATALVFPSFYEGFGYPPLEAMSQKCAIIVSNRASIPEICSDAALYIDPQDPNSILVGMKKILDDKNLRKDLIQKGLKRVKYFTNDNFIEKHIEQFKALL